MQLDMDEIGRLAALRLVNVVRDPESDLLLLNYTPKAQYDRAWDAYPILLDCRGTIVEPDGDVWAKPFRKFFNLGERPGTSLLDLAPLGPPHVSHKLDGSMITLFRDYHTGAARFATRGSFTSPQARAAARYWQEHCASAEERLNYRFTYVFEYTAPTNRIVVAYAREALTLIGVVDDETGRERDHAFVLAEALRLGLPAALDETHAGWVATIAAPRPNFEGYVLYWPHVPLRLKAKLDDYVRLHRIVTGLNEVTVWEHLSAGTRLDTLKDTLPDELHAWVDRVGAALHGAARDRREAVDSACSYVWERGFNAADRADRALIANLLATRVAPALHAAVWLALDGKDTTAALYKPLRPTVGAMGGNPVMQRVEG